MLTIDNYDMAIAELSLSGAISLGRCSRSTTYRWARTINEKLEFGKADWRVKADPETCSIFAVDPKDATGGKKRRNR